MHMEFTTENSYVLNVDRAKTEDQEASKKKYGALSNPFAGFQVLKQLVHLKYNKGMVIPYGQSQNWYLVSTWKKYYTKDCNCIAFSSYTKNFQA